MSNENNPKLNLFENIKSDYILKHIFQNLHEKFLLLIIKYNKDLQKRLGIGKNDYEDYQKIEIEIIPAKNKSGKFVNIDNNDDEIYYHIYLNGDKKESKSRYINKEDKINKIILIIDYEIKSLKKLFFECRCIEKINFLKCNRKDILDMEDMFYNCKSLKEINFNNNFNTDNVINMAGLFHGCSSLEKLNLNSFDTSNVGDIYQMFKGCSSLKELNLSNFRTNNVTDMSYMFYECSKLEELYVNNFYTNSLTGVRCMFYGVSKQLKEKIKKANEKIKVEAFLW